MLIIIIFIISAIAMFLLINVLIDMKKLPRFYNCCVEEMKFFQFAEQILFIIIAFIFFLAVITMSAVSTSDAALSNRKSSKEENKEIPIVKQYIYVKEDKNGELKIIGKENEIYKVKLEK